MQHVDEEKSMSFKTLMGFVALSCLVMFLIGCEAKEASANSYGATAYAHASGGSHGAYGGHVRGIIAANRAARIEKRAARRAHRKASCGSHGGYGSHGGTSYSAPVESAPAAPSAYYGTPVFSVASHCANCY